jgi:2-polyprenyl-6-hydroxyphenyl methylase/3-demethylubiquinone-9 3-methyltransferase
MSSPISSRYHEHVWEATPEGAEPIDLSMRVAFVLDRLRANSGSAQTSEDRPGHTDGSQQPVARLRVLDVGCGEAQITAELARAGFDVVGVDVAEEPLRRARRRHPQLDVRLVGESEWALADASFDAVFSGETIEHVRDTIGWLSEVRRVLRSGGSLLLSTPAHGPLSMLATALSPRAFAHRFDPRSDHLRFYSARTLARLLADFGFERIDVRSAGGVPGARRVLLASAVRSRF